MSVNVADISEVLLQLGLADSCTETQRAIAQEALRMATGAVTRHLKYNPVKTTHIEYYPQQDFRKGQNERIWEVTDILAYQRELSESITDELQVKHIPIRNVVSLKIDYDGRFGARSGSFGSETAQTEGVDFWPHWESVDSSDVHVCMDGIIRSEGRWPDIPGSVKIEYEAGFTDAELHGQDDVLNASPILDAVIDEAIRRFLKVMNRSKKRLAGFSGPLVSEGMGDYNYSVNTAALNRLMDGSQDLLPETIHKLSEFEKYDLGVM